MRRVLHLFAFCLSVATAFGLHAQPTDAALVEVPRPDVKPGDRWAYQRVDRMKGNETTPYEQQVTFAGKDAIIAVNKERDREVDVNYTAEWNLVTNAFGWVFTPNLGLLRFPLKPGATYVSRYEIRTNPNAGNLSRVEMKIKVVGWEEVTVPAGKFKALKVAAEGDYSRQDVSGGGGVAMTLWYVPEVKRWVRSTVTSTDFRRQPAVHLQEELIAFDLKQ